MPTYLKNKVLKIAEPDHTAQLIQNNIMIDHILEEKKEEVKKIIVKKSPPKKKRKKKKLPPIKYQLIQG